MNTSRQSQHSRATIEQLVLKILQQHDIRIDHPDNCEQEATHCIYNPGFDDPELVDWLDLPFVTIDNPDSRDLDQALLIESANASGYRVRYALADAAYYVPPGSALFAEALRRGVTYYTPLLAAPMLPTVLSEGLVSLNPNERRRSLVFDMQLAADGAVLSTVVVRALVRSQAKLSYESVQSFYDAKEAHKYEDKDFAESLELLKTLGEILIQRALDRDVIPFNRSESSISITDNGIEIMERKRVRTEKYNEQISLLCNMQGAALLAGLRRDVPELQAIFRVHDAPLSGRLKALRKLISDFVQKNNLDDSWLWKKEQSLADYVQALPDSASARHKVLAIERQILVSNQASEYRKEPGRHHALAASNYARFSSPMREIVGVFTHKELLEALGTKPSSDTTDATPELDDHSLRESVIEIANQSRQTQKQINKAIEFLALQSLLNTDLDADDVPTREGIIMGFRRDRIYVACPSIAIDLKVSQSDIESQYQCVYDIGDICAVPTTEKSANGAPEWNLGDSVKVQADSFDSKKNRYKLKLYPIPDQES